jgi:cytochrome c biogenesis protein CcmG/thiol:disulfide interchange protein DsbE
MSAPPTVRPVGALTRTVVGVLVLAACGGTPDPAGVGTTPAVIVRPAPLLPTTTDALPAMSPPQYERLLEQLRGTPLVVNFWASWCVPCEAEAPLLRAAAARHGERIQFLGVDILDARDAATAFVRSHRLPYPNVFDPEGAIRDAVGSTGQPVTVFYAADGTVAAKIDGQLSERSLSDAIDRIAG